MKLLFSLFILLFSYTTSHISAQDLVTSYRTDDEKRNEEWFNKITDEQEVNGLIVQLVTSKGKDDFQIETEKIQVFDKGKKECIQQFEIVLYSSSDSFSFVDFNFDGYDDLEFDGGYGTLDNKVSYIIFYDPKINMFGEDEFSGSNVEIDYDTKTISTSNRCCAGSEEEYTKYTFRGKDIVLLEKQCLTSNNFDDEGYQIDNKDEEGYLIFREKDCMKYLVDIEIREKKKESTYRFVIYDKDLYGGFVQRVDSSNNDVPRIPIHLDWERSKNLEKKSAMYIYNQIDNDVVNGSYSFQQKADSSYTISFTPHNSKQKIKFEIIHITNNELITTFD